MNVILSIMNKLEQLYEITKLSIDPKFHLTVETTPTFDAIEKFINYENGLVVIFPFVQGNNETYYIVSINRTKRIIHVCNTRGTVLDCDSFNRLSNLKDKHQGFILSTYTYSCENNDDVFAVFLADIFTHYDHFYLDKVPSDDHLTNVYRKNIEAIVQSTVNTTQFDAKRIDPERKMYPTPNDVDFKKYKQLMKVYEETREKFPHDRHNIEKLERLILKQKKKMKYRFV